MFILFNIYIISYLLFYVTTLHQRGAHIYNWNLHNAIWRVFTNVALLIQYLVSRFAFHHTVTGDDVFNWNLYDARWRVYHFICVVNLTFNSLSTSTVTGADVSNYNMYDALVASICLYVCVNV
jgi:hypothetical protein